MIRAKAPDVGILILSGYPEEHYAVNLIRQGASGYLNKECDPAEIVNAIRTISLGRRYISPTVAELLAQQLNRKDDTAPHEQLSEREFQVFLRLAKGETAGDIAKALAMGAKAVLIGRAYAYGLGAGGQAGVARAIQILRADLVRALKLLGCPSVAELDESYVTYPAEWRSQTTSTKSYAGVK